MKICLIAAPTITDFCSTDEFDAPEVRSRGKDPPLGILSLAALLGEIGLVPCIMDVNNEYLSFLKSGCNKATETFACHVASLLIEQNSDLYGFSSICSTFPLSIRIAELVKRGVPSCTILFGGPQASVVDVHALRAFSFIDLILRGEAEYSLITLVKQLRINGPLDAVMGLTYRKSAEICRNPDAPVIEDLDQLPLPAYHLTQYLENAGWAALELGRGCPFACTFCSTNDFFRRRFRLRSPEIVVRDMKQLNVRYGITRFELVHDMFTVDRRRVVEFCEHMIKAKTHFEWSCSARTDCVDEDLLQLMKQAGCIGVFYGVESGSERMQSNFNKNLDVNRAKLVIKNTDQVGISSTVSLITGFPDETWDDVRCTVAVFTHAARYPRAKPQLNLLAPLAGTPLWNKHHHELLLGDVLSDLSSQGLHQDTEDVALIQKLPLVFPNFYHIPTPHLNRLLLFELHQFLMCGVQRFRWLLVAISESEVGISNVFFEWQEHRVTLYGKMPASQIRQYYRESAFQVQFLRFLKRHAAYTSYAVKSFLDLQVAIDIKAGQYGQRSIATTIVRADDQLRWSDIPLMAQGKAIFRAKYDLDGLIAGFASGITCEPILEEAYYLINFDQQSSVSVRKISKLLGALLLASDGRPNNAVMRTWLQAADVSGEEGEESIFLNILAELRARGVVTVYREPTDG